MLLQNPDMVAHRALRDQQLFTGTPETEQPGDSFESAQRLERGQGR
jgi:hypothetical protein